METRRVSNIPESASAVKNLNAKYVCLYFKVTLRTERGTQEKYFFVDRFSY